MEVVESCLFLHFPNALIPLEILNSSRVLALLKQQSYREMLRLTRPTDTLDLTKPLFLHLSSILHQMRFQKHGWVHEVIRRLFWRKYGLLRGVLGSVVEFMRHCLGQLKILLSLV